MDFVIDTVGENNEKEESGNSIVKQILEEYKESLKHELKNSKKKNITKGNKDNLDDFFKGARWSRRKSILNTIKNEKAKDQKKEIEEILKKSVITPDFEKLHSVPPYAVSVRRMRKEKQAEREKTKGKKWYGLPATELTEEVKHDLEVLQMRSVLDPKHFYKKNDLKVLPKYFQIGKVMDSPLDFYNNRLTKKQRKKTLVDELLADAEFSKYNKRKYKQIIEEKQKTDYKAWRQAKRLKKKNK